MSDSPKISAIVLAAGRSDRMKYPKSLLIFGKETAIDRIVRIATGAGCDPVIVVLGHEADRVRANASLAGATIVINDAHESGQTSSIQAGIRALPRDTSAFLLFPVDHAMVDPSTVEGLVAAHADAKSPIVVPVHHEHRGHPALFDAALIPEFLALAPGAPAHLITRADASRVLGVPTEDEEVLSDMDTPADYHRALEVYSQRGGEAGFLAPKGAGRPAPKRPPV